MDGGRSLEQVRIRASCGLIVLMSVESEFGQRNVGKADRFLAKQQTRVLVLEHELNFEKALVIQPLLDVDEMTAQVEACRR